MRFNLKTEADIFAEFERELSGGHLHHATLVFAPSREEGDVFLNKLAKAILCEGDWCNGKNPCKACIMLSAGSHPDLFTFPKGKNFLVADAEQVSSEAQISPMFARNKVLILQGMDTATPQSQNKMLKLLEDPPASTVFLLSAANEESVLRTIISRCHKIYLPRIKNAIPEKQKKLYDELCTMLADLKTSKDVFPQSVKFSSNKELFLEKLTILSGIFGEILHKTRENNGFSEKAIVKIIKQINLTKQKKQQNVNPNLLSDMLLLKILEFKFLNPIV